MSYVFSNLTPGQQASRESVEKRLLWGPPGHHVVTSAVLDSTTVDARSTLTNELLPGLVLGKITSTGKYVHSLPTATDGSQVAVALLGVAVNTKDAGGTARDQFAAIVVSGAVVASECGGLTTSARGQLGRILFDDDFIGNRWAGAKVVIAKTADYTVLTTDNGAIFTNQGASGAVNFTLPAITRGLHYQFCVEADQNLTITAATADTLVVFNDAAADSIAFSTSSEKVGGWFEVFANADATKWLVKVSLGAETQTPTIAT